MVYLVRERVYLVLYSAWFYDIEQHTLTIYDGQHVQKHQDLIPRFLQSMQHGTFSYDNVVQSSFDLTNTRIFAFTLPAFR